MGPVLGQCSTIPPLSFCRSGRWMPSGSRALFTLSWVFRLGTAHRLTTISFNNSDLSPAKVTFRVGISPRFSSIRWKQRIETSCSSGLRVISRSHQVLCQFPFNVFKGTLVISLGAPCTGLLKITSEPSEGLAAPVLTSLWGPKLSWTPRDTAFPQGEFLGYMWPGICSNACSLWLKECI